MPRYRKNRIITRPNRKAADVRVTAREVVGFSPTSDGRGFEFLVRDPRGLTLALDVPIVVLQQALDHFANRGDIALSATTEHAMGRMALPAGGWRLMPAVTAGEPVLACRGPDGMGVQVGISHDPVTAVPRVKIAVDL